MNKSLYSEILSDNHKFGDKIFFVVNSYDKPNVFLRFYGEILNKEVLKNNVRYHVSMIKCFEDKSNVIENLQGQSLRLVHKNSKRSVLKKFYLNSIINSITYEEEFQTKFKKYLFVVDNFFCAKTQNEINELHELTTSISKKVIKEMTINS